jgi:exodeoxyribonuclease VII small subunit
VARPFRPLESAMSTAKPAPANAAEDPVAQFEKNMQALEQVVEQLERGELSLEAAIQAYERGDALVKVCQQGLEQARQRIQQLSTASTPNAS